MSERGNPDNQPIEPAGTVIEVEGGMEYVSNGFVWLACTPGNDATTYRAITPERMNRRVWWVVSKPPMTTPWAERVGGA